MGSLRRPWVAAWLIVLLASQTSPSYSSKILVLTPFGSRSVRGVFAILCRGLASAGHQVTFVSSGAPHLKDPNILEITAPPSQLDSIDLFEVREKGLRYGDLISSFPKIAEDLYAMPSIQRLWRERKSFDAVVINSAANEMAFPFLINVSAPFVTFAPAGTESIQLSYMGNIVSPATIPTFLVPYANRMDFKERFINTVVVLLMRYSFRRTITTPIVDLLRKTFPDMEDPYEMYPRQSLAILNYHHLLDGSIPLLPNQVEAGCIHCVPSRRMEHDLQSWLDEAQEGVVYFSLGAMQGDIPLKYKKILLEAFSRMPYRVIAKILPMDGYEVPSNMLLRKWLPQQDILGHPNVVAFISHCGKLSASEALYHGVPILGLPIAYDHPRTCSRMEKRREAIVLQWEDLTVDLLLQELAALLRNPVYSARVKAVSSRIQDQRETGLEKAVWWVEYVMKHGDDLLRFSGAELSIFQYALLDVLLVLVLLATSLLVALVYVGSLLLRVCQKRRKGAWETGVAPHSKQD